MSVYAILFEDHIGAVEASSKDAAHIKARELFGAGTEIFDVLDADNEGDMQKLIEIVAAMGIKEQQTSN